MEYLAAPPEEGTIGQLYNDVTFVDDVTGRVLDKTMGHRSANEGDPVLQGERRLHQDAPRARHEKHCHQMA